MDTIRIRVADTSDAATIAAIVNRAFAVERFFKRGDRTSPEGVAGMMREGSFLVLEVEQVPAGVVFVRTSQPHGYFGMLAIEPDRKGRGLGRALVDAAECHLAGAGCTHVDIHVVNLRDELPPYYARLGYAVVGERPFPDPAEATRDCHMIVMRKPLSRLEIENRNSRVEN